MEPVIIQFESFVWVICKKSSPDKAKKYCCYFYQALQ